ncbi:MAG: PHP domain-containing protein, partial [Nanoarchaeota archaeon]
QKKQKFGFDKYYSLHKMIDLQNHTVASDGELTAEQLVDLAIEKKLSAIAITDHDSLDSLEPAIKYSKGKNIEIVPGVELSCDDPLFNYDKIDVLGLLIDFNNKGLNDLIGHIKNKREENKKLIIEKLKNLGYKIEYEDVKKMVKGTFGRPHIAKYLLKKYPDKFTSVSDVFDKLIGHGKRAYLDTKGRVSIKDGIKIIQNAGGVAILAHPGVYPRKDSLKIIGYFIESDGDGIETYYPYHIICPELKIDENGNQEMIKFYKKIAKSKKLLESGGNDYHGNDRATLGEVEIPESVLENLKKRIPVS